MRFSRLVSLISLTIFSALGLVIISSWATMHAIGGGQRFSEGVRKSVLALAEFPTQAKSLVGLLNNFFPPKGVSNIYSNYLELASGSNRISGYFLISCISSNGANVVSLIDLSDRASKIINLPPSNDRVGQYSDYLIGSEPRRQSSFSSRHRVWHPYLSKEGILTYTIPCNDLISVDLKTGQEKWRVRGAFHHSLEPDGNGNLWVCGAVQSEAVKNPVVNIKHFNKNFEDQAIVKVSSSGKILQTISLADIIVKSGLEYLLYGLSNLGSNPDPIHLNQITPIQQESEAFKKGQLLVSLRNLSTVLLIDPVSQKIVWHRSGNWMGQHCVVPSGETRFSLLDNHSATFGGYWLSPDWKTRIIEYDVVAGKSTQVKLSDDPIFNLQIPIEGRALPIAADTWLIEDSMRGTVIIICEKKIIFKWSNVYPDGTVGILSWCRYIPTNQVPDFIMQRR